MMEQKEGRDKRELQNNNYWPINETVATLDIEPFHSSGHFVSWNLKKNTFHDICDTCGAHAVVQFKAKRSTRDFR